VHGTQALPGLAVEQQAAAFDLERSRPAVHPLDRVVARLSRVTRSRTARLAGSAYLSYIVVGILNEVLMYRAAGVNGIAAKLARMADYSTDVRLAIMLKLGECFSVFVLAVTLYGIDLPGVFRTS
jgi:hypothetical protein